MSLLLLFRGGPATLSGTVSLTAASTLTTTATGQMVPAAGWQAFKDGGDTAALDNIRAQIEKSEPATD